MMSDDKASMASAFKDLSQAEDKDAMIKAVELLSEVDEDVAMKTEIAAPLRLSMLKTIGSYLDSKGLDSSGKHIDTLIDNLLVYMVSHNRQGRKEIIDALFAMGKGEEQEDETKLSDKMLQRDVD